MTTTADKKHTAVNGCSVCGKEQRTHSLEWVESRGFHRYVIPTDAQRKARMLAKQDTR